MDVSIDTSEIEALAAALAHAPQKALVATRAVIQKGALNIKNGMKADSSGIRHAPYFPASITYDTAITRTGIEAEIGPDKSRPQGALGNILAFGTSKNGPVFDHTAALRRELPSVEEFMGKIGVESL